MNKIEDWEGFVSLAYSHGIFPLVYRTLKEYAHLIPEYIFAHMKQNYMDIVKQNMLMTSELIKVIKILEENGIEAISFKGPVLSQMAYGDVVSRQYCDLDILVKKENLIDLDRVLSLSDYEISIESKFLENYKLLEIGSDFSIFSKNNIHIEVHWNLFRKLINNDLNKYKIWNDKKKITLNNININTLEINNYLLYLCIHGSKHLWERIEWINDIERLISKYDIDWKYVLNQSKSLKNRRIFLLGILISQTFYSITIPSFINDEIKKDLILNKIESKIISFYQSRYFLQEGNLRDIMRKFVLISQLQDNKYETIKYFVSSIFKPTHYDVYFVTLPKQLDWLYYLIRPIRFLANFFKK